MSTFRDLSGNGLGVVVEPPINTVDLSSVDYSIPGKARRLNVGGAGNIIVRSPGSDADVTIAAIAGQSIPIAQGTVIRKTGTTATGLTTSSF